MIDDFNSVSVRADTPLANPRLTFHQPHPGGRILLMLGEHQIGAVFPPPNKTTMARPVWRWSFWLPGDGLSRWIFEDRAKTEQAAKNALLAKARDWLREAGIDA